MGPCIPGQEAPGTSSPRTSSRSSISLRTCSAMVQHLSRKDAIFLKSWQSTEDDLDMNTTTRMLVVCSVKLHRGLGIWAPDMPSFDCKSTLSPHTHTQPDFPKEDQRQIASTGRFVSRLAIQVELTIWEKLSQSLTKNQKNLAKSLPLAHPEQMPGIHCL